MPPVTNDGRKLEQLVRHIHETLKDAPHTQILSNYKIRNLDGRLREFDVFVECEINKSRIQMAIECKSFKSRVSVEKIEAFAAKCDGIPSINKRIFVSESGYQIGATKAAERLGIELHNLSDVDTGLILSWLPISQMALRFLVKKSTLVIDSQQIDLTGRTEPLFDNLYFENSPEAVSVNKLVSELVIEKRDQLWNLAILNFIRCGGSTSVGKVFSDKFGVILNPPGFIYINGAKYTVVGIHSAIDYWLIEKPAAVIASKSFREGENIKANVVSLGLDQEQTDIIITDNKFKMFHRDKDGKIEELKTLLKYDPNTDTFTYP